MSAILATLYLLIICFAFWGYGRFLVVKAFPEVKSKNGLSISFGISLFILISGYLELLHLASAGLFKSILIIGVLLGFFAVAFELRPTFVKTSNHSSNHHNPKKSAIGAAISILIAITSIAITLSYFYYLPLNVHDDFNGYLILCQRILQEGFQGGDPFNDHSIEQGFGAGNYILALASVHVPLMNLHLADAGIGLILLSAFIFDAAKNSPYKTLRTLGPSIVILCITLINAPIVNTTPLLVACGLFLAIVTFYSETEFGLKTQTHILLALLLSSFLALKGNYVVPVAALTLSICLSLLTLSGPLKTLKTCSIYTFCFLVFISPWMLSNWLFSGTLFYPLLGHGLVAPNALTLSTLKEFLEANFNLLPSYSYLISALLFLNLSPKIANKNELFFFKCLSITAIGFACALTTTSAGLFTRYSYVSLFGPAIFLTIYLIFNTKIDIKAVEFKKNKVKLILLSLLAVVLIPNFFYGVKHSARELVNSPKFPPSNISQTINLDEESFRIRNLQMSIPEQARVLLRLDFPFLADFTRQKIHIMDWPGNVGPSPGVPFSESPESLAQYLRNQNIQFILYSYKNEALFSSHDQELASRVNHPNPWIRAQATRTFAVQSQINALKNQYSITFDNGQDFIIDLNSKKP